jgi:hypothetical protein
MCRTPRGPREKTTTFAAPVYVKTAIRTPRDTPLLTPPILRITCHVTGTQHQRPGYLRGDHIHHTFHLTTRGQSDASLFSDYTTIGHTSGDQDIGTKG